jgi:hypothetical protein
MAGRAPVKYTTDESGKVIADPNQPVDTKKAQLMRIAATGLAGLGAGARAGGQKSGLANALSGLGAGAENQMQRASAADDKAKQEARQQNEDAEQMKLHKMELAKGQALLVSTYTHMHENDMDRNEDYKAGAALAQSAEDSGVSVQRVNGDKLMTMLHESPEQLLTEGKVVVVGETAVTNPETGQAYLDPETHAPKYERQYAVIDGMHAGTLKVPDATIAYIKKYAPYSKDYAGITGLDGLSNDHEMDMKQLAKLHNAAVDGRKQVLIGEEKPLTMMDPNTKQPILINSVTKEPLKNKDGSPMTPNAKNEPAESGAAVAKEAETERHNRAEEAEKARQDRIKDAKETQQKGLGQSYALQNREFDTIRKPLTTSLDAFATLRSSLDQGTATGDSVVAPALLKALVAGGGVRITQAEINNFQHGRSTVEDMKGVLQKMTSGKSITPKQREQVYDLLGAVEAKAQAKKQILESAQDVLDTAGSVAEQRKAVSDARRKLDLVDAGKYNQTSETNSVSGQTQPTTKQNAPAAPAVGDVKQYNGANYKFDGGQWVKQ